MSIIYPYPLQLPDLKEKEDIYDWIESGGTYDKLLNLEKITEFYQPLESNSTNQKVINHKSKYEKVKFWLDENYDIRFNTLLSTIEFKKKNEIDYRELNDREENTFLFDINSEIEVTKSLLSNVLNSSYIKKYNPTEAFINTLPVWDGEDYIKILLEYVKLVDPEKNEIKYLYLKRWLIASIACFLDNKPNHSCLIFTGGQGIGKTSFFRKFSISPEYTYEGVLNPSNKDSKFHITENTLIILDELESTTKFDFSFIKSLITLKDIKERRPYAHRAETSKRHASFCGSINQKHILADTTGARRWLILEVESIDYDSISQELITNSWSQAYASYKNGEKYWFDGTEIDFINRENEQFNTIDSAEELLLSFYYPSKDYMKNNGVIFNDELIIEEYFTATEIIQKITNEKNIKIFPNHLGRVLTKFNFERKKKEGIYKYKVLSMRNSG